ncbi:MAG TPA: L-rhamnose/proton symporter RhaT, partial [Terracidiphilus sp.]
IQGFAAWIVAPLVLCSLFVPHPFAILGQVPAATIEWTIFWGALWGMGGITFGLSIRYLGLALGYAIALGFCTAFGTLIPPAMDGSLAGIAHVRSGQVVLLGVFVCLVAIAVNGVAGYCKEHEVSKTELSEAGERDFSLTRGLAVAVFAGIMSSFFAVGLHSGKPIADLTREQLVASGRLELWQNLPVLIVVLWGGFATNFVWSAILILRNRSGAEFFGKPGRNPMRAAAESGYTVADLDPTDLTLHKLPGSTVAANYLFAALAGVIWYFQFFFYSMGQTKMGKLDFSSWTLHMASIILFATLWGLVLKEWKGTSVRTKLLVTAGVALLIGSTVVVGAGNYIKTMETAPQTASAN